MSVYLAAWAVCATVGAFVVLAVVVGLEVRDYRAGRDDDPAPVPAPRVPQPRQPSSAAAVVVMRDVAAFEEFLAELIVTPHVETALS